MRYRYDLPEELVDTHNVKVETVSEQSIREIRGGNTLFVLDTMVDRVTILA